MVGLNHEMARELLWREYPTDQRGTYFRQFWDPSISLERERLRYLAEHPEISSLPSSVEEDIVENHRDIKEIHTWGTKDALLTPLADIQREETESDRTFLMIKGELLRKYPDAAIYTIPGIWYNQKRTLLTGRKRHEQTEGEEGEKCQGAIMESGRICELDEDKFIKEPVFKGIMEPDVTFFGFALSDKQLKGSAVPDNDEEPNDPCDQSVIGGEKGAGYFFIIQQQPSGPQFGLDEFEPEFDENGLPIPPKPINTWDELNWGHMEPLSKSGYIRLRYPNEPQELEHPELRGNNEEGRKIGPVQWRSHSADMANITLQKPVRIAIHAMEMISQNNLDKIEGFRQE